MKKTQLNQLPQVIICETPLSSTILTPIDIKVENSSQPICFSSINPSKKTGPKTFSCLSTESKKNLHKNKKFKKTRLDSLKFSKSLFNTSIIERESKFGFLTLLFKKVLVLLLVINFFIIAFILMQTLIDDFCFVPMLCACHNLGIYFYSVFRELIQYDYVILTWSYFFAAYMTENFFGKKSAKYLFLALELVILSGFFFIFYNKRKDDFLHDFRIWRAVIITIVMVLYIVLNSLISKHISRDFLRKFVKIGFFTTFYYIHCLLIRYTVSLYLFEFLLQKFTESSAKNIFKMIYLVYYLCYNYIASSFIFIFYQDFLKKPGSFSIEMIVLSTKFITIEVISVQVMNVLTTPLDEIYFWIMFAHYIFSLVSNYFGWNFWQMVLNKIKRLFWKKKVQGKTNEDKERENLRRGCILEANLIIFTRILIFFFYQRFFYILKYTALFADCSLQISDLGLNIDLYNMILIFLSHTGIVALILFLMMKKKMMLFEIIEENLWVIIKDCLFICTQIEESLQLYYLLNIWT